MKNKKFAKALLLVLCAILLVCASVMGTLAYLTSGDEVTNTFTVGKVKITLDETKVDVDGKPVLTDGEATRDDLGYEYHLIPGSTYTKDPIVHIEEGSESCYVFIKVQNGIDAVEATGDTDIETQILVNWKKVDGVDNVYYQKWAEGSTDRDLETFSKFKIDIEKTNDDLDAVKNNKVIVTAYAIQAENVENTEMTDDVNAKAAWEIVSTKENLPANP